MNIFHKMSAITQEIATVSKNLEVGYGGNKYKAVSEADVLKAVKPIEAKHGVYSFPFDREITETDVFVTESKNGNPVQNKFMRIRTVYRFVNMDDPKEYVDIVAYGDGVDTQDKAPGKAMTYADKYALLKAYKIQTGEDPDAQASQEGKYQKAITNAPETQTGLCPEASKKRLWAVLKRSDKDPIAVFKKYGATYDGLTTQQYGDIMRGEVSEG